MSVGRGGGARLGLKPRLLAAGAALLLLAGAAAGEGEADKRPVVESRFRPEGYADLPGVTWINQVEAVEMEGNTKPFVFVSHRRGCKACKALASQWEHHAVRKEFGKLQETFPFNWIDVDARDKRNKGGFISFLNGLKDDVKFERAGRLMDMTGYGGGQYTPKIVVLDKDLKPLRKFNALNHGGNPKYPNFYTTPAQIMGMLRDVVRHVAPGLKLPGGTVPDVEPDNEPDL